MLTWRKGGALPFLFIIPDLKFTELNKAVEAFRGSKDPQAFRYVYDLLSGRLYYICLRYLKNEHDAQDILQETFVTVYHKIDSFGGQGSFEGWIRKITVNQCLNKLRLDKKHFELNDRIREQDTLIPEEAEEKHATEEHLLKALHELPVGYRTILNLAVLEDYSHKEISRLLNITESTSRSQLSRAKIALREKLNGL